MTTNNDNYDFSEGKIVPEEEVAKDLGFKDVYEMRRWGTELGYKVFQLEHELSIANNDVRNFQSALKKIEKVLEKTEQLFEKIVYKINDSERKEIEELELAIKVVCGRGVDWDNKLTWLK